MKIIFAENIGFCSGVKRAISIAEKAIKEDPKPIQFLGNLVHNEKVIEKFKKKGVKFVKDFRKAKEGTLIIQAHGFPPFSGKINKELLIRDATCPLVKNVQLTAALLHKKGYKVIIVGDKNHSETKGINGYVKNKAIIIESENQAEKLNLSRFKKIGVVSQTTQNLSRFNKILKILRSRMPRLGEMNKIKSFNTICPEVIVRQKDLANILKKSEGVLIIGSHLSANTKRLVQIVKKFRKQAIWINSLEELKDKKIRKISTLGVISGTSTPDWEIKKIKKYLNSFK